jgi:hypothetical protein
MPDDSAELARVCREIVFKVAAISFAGKHPNDPHAIVGSILQILPAGTPAERLEEIIPYLFCAVREYEFMQDCQFPL